MEMKQEVLQKLFNDGRELVDTTNIDNFSDKMFDVDYFLYFVACTAHNVDSGNPHSSRINAWMENIRHHRSEATRFFRSLYKAEKPSQHDLTYLIVEIKSILSGIQQCIDSFQNAYLLTKHSMTFRNIELIQKFCSELVEVYNNCNQKYNTEVWQSSIYYLRLLANQIRICALQFSRWDILTAIVNYVIPFLDRSPFFNPSSHMNLKKWATDNYVSSQQLSKMVLGNIQ